MLRKYEWNMQGICDTMKTPILWITGVEEGKEIQTKGTDNLFNTIIAENFLTSQKWESPRCRKLTKYQTVRTKKRNIPKHSIIKTLSTKKEFWKLQKRKDKSYIKANPLEKQQISQLKL
jgi:hypothetical protein